MEDCIFCKIVAGTIPVRKLYEDELVVAFLDIGPINLGHALIIPKEHHQSASTIPEHIAGRMFHLGGRLGLAIKRALDVDGFNLHLADGACAWQVVMHAHLHVIPRSIDDGFHWNWRQLEYKNDDEREKIASIIEEKLK